MNYLAHIYLSENENEIIIGNFMADSIKGKNYLNYSKGLQTGILLHRFIDSFTDNHKTYRNSKKLLQPTFNHYSGIIMDIFYDYFLAINWKKYHKTPYEEFVLNFYELLENNKNLLTLQTLQILPIMIKNNWLLKYRTPEGIKIILSQMSNRIKSKIPLENSIDILEKNHSILEKDFFIFFDDIIFASKLELQLLKQTKAI